VKRSLAAAALALALVCAASPALAQVYGILNDAKVVPLNGHLGGGYLQFDKSSATLMGQLRLSLYPNMDFGFVGGLSRLDIDNDTKSSVRLATDFRGQISNQSANFPVSITLGAAIALESADGFSLLSVGPTAAASRVLDQDVTHSHGGDAEEVRPVLPIDLFFINQPQVGLVNQVGGLERVAGALRAQIIPGQPSQLTVDQRRQFIERGLIAIAPPDEQLSYGRRG